jgi:hypothetical protein
MWRVVAKLLWSTVGSRVVTQVAQQLAESPEVQRFLFRINQSAVRTMRKFSDRNVYKPVGNESPADSAQRAAQQAKTQQQGPTNSTQQRANSPQDTPSQQSYFPDEYTPWKRWYLTKKYEYMVWKNERKGK